MHDIASLGVQRLPVNLSYKQDTPSSLKILEKGAKKPVLRELMGVCKVLLAIHMTLNSPFCNHSKGL